MIAIQIVGLLFALAGYVIYRRYRRARREGAVGTRFRRIHRAQHPVRFRIALAVRAVSALICFAAAYACFTHGIHRMF